MKILERIISIRKHKGFSQKDIAQKLGIATFNYGKIERGETNLTLNRLDKLAEILEVNISDFFINTPTEDLNNSILEAIKSESIQVLETNNIDVGLKIVSDQYNELKNSIDQFFIKLAKSLLKSKDPLIETTEPESLYNAFSKAYLDGYKIEGLVYDWFVQWAKVNMHLDAENPEKSYKKIGTLDLKTKNTEKAYLQWSDWFYKYLFFECFKIEYISEFIKNNLILVKSLSINLYRTWEEYSKFPRD